jgi:hypothetical protein
MVLVRPMAVRKLASCDSQAGRHATPVAKCSLDHRRNNSDQTISNEADRNEARRDRQNKERRDHRVGHGPPYPGFTGFHG